jgi:hypothetical protein
MAQKKSSATGCVPICFMLDDTAPVNLMTYHHPERPHKLVIPNALWEEFGAFCAEHGVRGKTSVVPCPSGLGRIDQGLWPLPEGHLEGFLAAMRGLEAQFDLTPEIVTHQMVVDPKTQARLHWYEDEWVAQHDRAEIADYLSFALRILKNVGLKANGMTSPWATGITNEKAYSAAISDALWRVNRVRHTWYFLHGDTVSPRVLPQVTYRDAEHGRTVVSLPSGCGDFLWSAQDVPTRREGLAAARAGMESVLSADGKSGRFVELLHGGGPLVFHSHAQSLFSNGTRAGLQVFEETILRVERYSGEAVRWVKCSELAEETRRRAAPQD